MSKPQPISIGLILLVGLSLQGLSMVRAGELDVVRAGTGLPPMAIPPARFAHERPSLAWRKYQHKIRPIVFSGPIQHVVVIYMENRTPDDLFGGYFGTPYPTGGTFGSQLDLYNPTPSSGPTLSPNPIGAYFDPDHSHHSSFYPESQGRYGEVGLGCKKTNGLVQCPPGASVYSYVPAPEPSPYVAMITNFAYANHVLQANEGPSYVAHQYAIAGQSGGITDLPTPPPMFQYAPYAQAENPGNTPPAQPPTGNYDEETAGAPLGNCYSGNGLLEYTLNMTQPFPGQEPTVDAHPPCAEYQTILDETVGSLGIPAYYDWQYIASVPNGIWAAPMAINHLYTNYENGNPATQPFAVDPDAINFANNLQSTNPTRPFAALTYITPCINESDHPLTNGTSDGPDWLAHVVNAIGESSYWPNTTIIVTWDDWGGFYDHYQPGSGNPPSFPYHPFPNPYDNPNDPNEWGFRVPMIVISPYVTSRGYISTALRSQSAILNYIESTFDLPSLQADDMSNGSDNLGDMFNFGQKPLPYIPVNDNKFTTPLSCANG